MNEANPLKISHNTISKFAKLFEEQTGISKAFNIQDVFLPLGGKINHCSAKEYNISKFLTIFSTNNFEINLINGMDKEFQRLLLIQSIGHYILHSNSGINPCFISSASNSPTSKEGFLFSLELLLPNEDFISIYNKFGVEYTANLFRMPKFAIIAKQKILNQLNLTKENNEKTNN